MQTTNQLRMTGREIKQMMRSNGQTIKSVAERMDVAQDRVRTVRLIGVTGPSVQDWIEGITRTGSYRPLRPIKGIKNDGTHGIIAWMNGGLRILDADEAARFGARVGYEGI